MSTISAVSTSAAAALTQARAATPATAQKATATKTASTAVNTADSVAISAETKAQLAQGKPFFASDGATGESTTDTARAGQSEEGRKAQKLETLQERSDAVSQRGAGKLERLKKRGALKRDKIGGRIQDESAQKKTRGDAQGERLGSKEQRIKTKAADRTELLTEQAKKQGEPVDQKRLDRIGGRVKDESAQKKTKLEGADGKRIRHEAKLKSRGRDRLQRVDNRSEARTKQVAGTTGKKLSKIEERMKALDPTRGGGDEQKIKGSATATPATATAAEAAATQTKAG